MEIYFTRHAQTELNKQKKIQGKSNSKLSEIGILQSALLGKRLKKIKFNQIYCSQLPRAKETLEIFLKYSNKYEKDVVFDERLNERSMGILEGSSYNIEDEISKVR